MRVIVVEETAKYTFMFRFEGLHYVLHRNVDVLMLVGVGQEPELFAAITHVAPKLFSHNSLRYNLVTAQQWESNDGKCFDRLVHAGVQAFALSLQFWD
jgi:hypothetical protein